MPVVTSSLVLQTEETAKFVRRFGDGQQARAADLIVRKIQKCRSHHEFYELFYDLLEINEQVAKA